MTDPAHITYSHICKACGTTWTGYGGKMLCPTCTPSTNGSAYFNVRRRGELMGIRKDDVNRVSNHLRGI